MSSGLEGRATLQVAEQPPDQPDSADIPATSEAPHLYRETRETMDTEPPPTQVPMAPLPTHAGQNPHTTRFGCTVRPNSKYKD